MSIFSVYAHGSWWAGCEDALDLDVLVVASEPMTQLEALDRVRYLLPPAARRLPLDLEVCFPDNPSPMHRAAILGGRRLAGDDFAATLRPVTPVEWAATMTYLAREATTTEPAAAALNSIRALWAAGGRVVLRKSEVPREAAGGPWEDLARAAWPFRHQPAFDHPDLAAVLEAAWWAAAGEAASPQYEREGWSSKSNHSALFTVFRGAFAADEVARLAAVAATEDWPGGWARGQVSDPVTYEVLGHAAIAANSYWWHHRLAGMERPEVHHYGAGSEFAAHVDKLPVFPDRIANVVGMVQRPDKGGQLYFELGGSKRIEPDLDPGDVIVFDGALLHGVTKVEAGERITVVSHLRREPWEAAA